LFEDVSDGIGLCLPTRPAWRGVSQAKINFSKARRRFVATQQSVLWRAVLLAGLGFAGNWDL
jgi:hypothetical protein